MKEGLSYQLFVGFIDYHFSFPIVPLILTLIGTMFFLINFGSYIPEIFLVIKNKSNEGISMLFCICNSTNQCLLLLNVLSLNFHEFAGIFQYSILQTFAALITILTLFFQWFLFLPVVYLNFVFNDQTSIQKEPMSEKKKQYRLMCIYLIINASAFTIFLIVWLYLGCTVGFNSHLVKTLGGLAGIVSAAIEVLQFIPQFITTIKLRDSGSLSLAMLSVQGPSLLCSGFYMWLVVHEEWTTYVCVIIDGAALISLLILCLFFKFWKMIQNKRGNLTQMSSVILEPILPVTDESVLM